MRYTLGHSSHQTGSQNLTSAIVLVITACISAGFYDKYCLLACIFWLLDAHRTVFGILVQLHGKRLVKAHFLCQQSQQDMQLDTTAVSQQMGAHISCEAYHTVMVPAWERVYRICLSQSMAICMMGVGRLKIGQAKEGR